MTAAIIFPVATRSGLHRPSVVGPQLECSGNASPEYERTVDRSGALTLSTTPTPMTFAAPAGYRIGSCTSNPFPIPATITGPLSPAIRSIPRVHQSSKGLPMLAVITSALQDF